MSLVTNKNHQQLPIQYENLIEKALILAQQMRQLDKSKGEMRYDEKLEHQLSLTCKQIASLSLQRQAPYVVTVDGTAYHVWCLDNYIDYTIISFEDALQATA